MLGINLIHAAFTLGDDTAAIISSLLAELSRSRLEARAAPLYSATWRESNPATLRPVPSDTCLLVLLSYCTLHGACPVVRLPCRSGIFLRNRCSKAMPSLC